ncbi:MAG: acyl-ACP--UDP-N-acetylglucosamine O-acyltransferase [Planctomycetia bacterium]|nr:acyl-ACP--UDP-N-acetylglucosamine O-acyltransferase [Planctomycetia bacterium]
MANTIHPQACVDSRAELGDDVEIGPFCVVGPYVKLGNGCRLTNNVTLIGHTTIGTRNRFFPNCVIGGEPQDYSYKESPTWVEIGDDNLFREGVTVNRGAEKEDHGTRIGHRNLLMSNAHVAHNCCVGNNVMLVNGVLLGGHVHVHDRAIISGNTVVHHFTSVGTMAFVSGGCRVVTDLPPFMLAAGNDNPEVKTINLVGMRRAGVSESSINVIKRAHRLIFREHKTLAEARDIFYQELDGILPIELSTLFNFMELTAAGQVGRAREVFRNAPSVNTREVAQQKAA